MHPSVHKSIERDALGLPTTRSSTLTYPEILSKQSGPPLSTLHQIFLRCISALFFTTALSADDSSPDHGFDQVFYKGNVQLLETRYAKMELIHSQDRDLISNADLCSMARVVRQEWSEMNQRNSRVVSAIHEWQDKERGLCQQ